MSARRSRRFWLGCLLVAVAVAAPCAAWYVAGSRAAHREADSLRQRPLERGNEIAIALGERLIGRLEAMRYFLSKFPYTDRNNKHTQFDPLIVAPVTLLKSFSERAETQ